MRYKVIFSTLTGTATFEIEAKGMVDARRRAKEKLRRNLAHFEINSIRPIGASIKESE